MIDQSKIICGVYKLFYMGKVVYVGQSKNINKRLQAHAADEAKIFDDWSFQIYSEEELDKEEARLIKKYKPIFNRKHNDQKIVNSIKAKKMIQLTKLHADSSINIGNSIINLCNNYGYSLGEYALKTGIAQSSISTIKSTNKCHTDTLQKLALDMPVSEFIKLGEGK